MNVLIGCEESQVVTKSFRDCGHDAFSCDIKSTRGNPHWHIKDDIICTLINEDYEPWDLIILHPDCTAMAVSGNRWYGKNMPYDFQRKDAVRWTIHLWELAKKAAPRVALENPVSVIFSEIPAAQYIQPYQFGHGETKKTGLALHNLPNLTPTDEVEGREQRVWKMPPSPNRKRDRSVTYQGIADAMAGQWGNL